MKRTGEEETRPAFFRSNNYIDLITDNLEAHVKKGSKKIKKSFEEYLEHGWGWVLVHVEKLEVSSARYRPLAASSNVSLPKKFEKKKALLNIQNLDQKCFVWRLLAHKLNVDRTQKPEREEIEMGDVAFPVALCHVPKSERLNNLRINVFELEGGEVIPLSISDREDAEAINLLLIVSEEGHHHYCLIRSFSRLLRNCTRHDGRRFYCYRYLHRFSGEDLLKEHTVLCNHHKI